MFKDSEAKDSQKNKERCQRLYVRERHKNLP